MTNKNQSTSWMQNTADKTDFLSKIKWLFKKWEDDGGKKKNKWSTAFHLTRKDSIVSVLVSLAIIWWAIYYGKMVIENYRDINSRSAELKNLSAYDISVNTNKLNAYAEWNSLSTINWMIEVNKNIQEEITANEIFKQQQQSYYEVLLQNVYLPSLNVWKDPYTQKFDISILWQKYLEMDKFQDLYLIQYWSDFAKYVWNDADYNVIDGVTIWDRVSVSDNPKYFYIPITISFTSPNKRSFLLLVNKLSTTSNQNNISLLNEFFFYLLRSIREKKSEVIDGLMQKYRSEFSSSSNWDLAPSLWEMTEEQIAIYRDRVIWYNLYHRLYGDLEWENTPLIDDDVIVKTIKDSALCTEDKAEEECFYNFRDKYRNLPYLAYKIWMKSQSNRTKWLLEFLQDLPPAIAITSFSFERYSDSSFLNNKQEEYRWEVTLNAYGRNILDSELEEASLKLWKLCFGNSSEVSITADLALRRVSDTITSLWENREYLNVYSLWELQWLLQKIQWEYGRLDNYGKMVKLFEIRRMMNDANLCNK